MANRTGGYISLHDLNGTINVLQDTMLFGVECIAPLNGKLSMYYVSKDTSRQPWVIEPGTVGRVFAPGTAVDAGQVTYSLSDPADSGQVMIFFANS